MHEFLMEIGEHSVLKLVCLFIVLDTIFGVLRAIKQRQFNSSFGIDGGLRKVAMLACVLTLFGADTIIGLNLLPFIPQNVLEVVGLREVGLTEFFGLLFVVYEALSVLKNMALLNLPIPKRLRKNLENLLSEFTDEVKEDETNE